MHAVEKDKIKVDQNQVQMELVILTIDILERFSHFLYTLLAAHGYVQCNGILQVTMK